MKQIKEAYTEIFNVCDKYANESYLSDSDFDDVRDMKGQAMNHLMIINWHEKYGLNIKHDRRLSGYNWVKIDDFQCFTYFSDAEAEKKKGSGRYISWEDNGKQPKDEWLLQISFSTGAYIFGDDYPKELFQEFWQELKSYNPKYCDTNNKCLYFSVETAKDVFNEFPEILKKYYDKNKIDSKQRKINRLKKELDELQTPN